jgi:carbonic anhydrase
LLFSICFLRNSKNLEFVNTVSEKNVLLTIERIHNESPILNEMEKNGEIKIVGAIYDVNTGTVNFIEKV